jgi:hypothetical protein
MAEHRINRREKKGLYVTRDMNGDHRPSKGSFDLWKLIDGPEKLLSGTDAAGRTVPLVNIGGGEDSDFRRMVTVCWGL